jgi:hypothetical protein
MLTRHSGNYAFQTGNKHMCPPRRAQCVARGGSCAVPTQVGSRATAPCVPTAPTSPYQPPHQPPEPACRTCQPTGKLRQCYLPCGIRTCSMLRGLRGRQHLWLLRLLTPGMSAAACGWWQRVWE